MIDINYKVAWYNSTFIFYLFIILTVTFVSLTFRKKNYYIRLCGHKTQLSILIIGVFLLFVKAFGLTGRDINRGYYVNFMSADSWNGIMDQTLEPGFKILLLATKKIIGQYWTVVFLVGIFTVVPVIYMISKYKNVIDVPSAFMIYTSLYFINSFSPARSYMATSICLFVFDALIEKNNKKAIKWLLVAFLIHRSALIMLIPIILMNIRLIKWKHVAFLGGMFFGGIYAFRNTIMAYFQTSSRYYMYALDTEGSIGFEQIVYYMPFFLLFFLAADDSDKRIKKINIIIISIGFVIGLLSYIVIVIGRLSPYTLPLIIIIPYYIRYLKIKKCWNIHILRTILLIYCVFRFYMYISQYYSAEDIMPYVNVFGWLI